MGWGRTLSGVLSSASAGRAAAAPFPLLPPLHVCAVQNTLARARAHHYAPLPLPFSFIPCGSHSVGTIGFCLGPASPGLLLANPRPRPRAPRWVRGPPAVQCGPSRRRVWQPDQTDLPAADWTGWQAPNTLTRTG